MNLIGETRDGRKVYEFTETDGTPMLVSPRSDGSIECLWDALEHFGSDALRDESLVDKILSERILASRKILA